MQGSRLAGELATCPEPAALEAEWRALEARADGRFFLSWPWIGTLIALAGPPSHCLRIRDGAETVGLALVYAAPGNPRALHLNETGDPAKDTIYIEYNGLLADRRIGAAAVEVAMQVLRAASLEKGGPRRIRMSCVTETWHEAAGRQPWLLARAHAQGCFGVDLVALRAAGGDYVGTLGRNSRQQLRRSLRAYADDGELRVERAADVAEAQAWLRALAELHQRRWEGRGKRGAFAEPFFLRFHDRLIATNHAAGAVDLLRVSAGSENLGYLYNFIHKDKVYFYQSGFVYGEGRDRRPGMVSHAKSIEFYCREGRDYYDFMAGGERYKASLGVHVEDLWSFTLEYPSLFNRVTNKVRRFKNRAKS
ncbi:GNAT family N-acetyltransferase [Oceanibacterium hippocampi]|uniref:BioF2-like acetyltransferase domain-containing protein n=1 Tax=Oceanibacterium hippocampi TaxID=745714 RepID=A0A1Y5TSH7_9PROT|nr:GNAT family N-acetyltransferase [Oceanibacterium hippocampi]SLN69144.1 hypothetical protein OCH7691_03160 [Oceanibacterium hippocampi]